MTSRSDFVTGVTGVTVSAVEPAISKNDFGKSPVTGEKPVTPVTKLGYTNCPLVVTGKTPVTPVTNGVSSMKRPEDPRPELTDDSHRWQRLLELAYALPEENMDGVYGTLLGLRCMGVRLFMINDKLQMTHGEMDPEEYKQCREKYLIPFAAKIAALIGKVG